MSHDDHGLLVQKCQLCERDLEPGQLFRLTVSLLSRTGHKSAARISDPVICLECFRSLGAWMKTREAGAARRGE